FSTDFIGQNYDYPEADYKTREQIAKRHLLYQQGLVWTLANHPRVPASVRAVVSKWGVCKDEFTNNGGWPTQLYIREARRMVSAFVMTQHHCQGRKNADAESVGMAAYTMDSHHVQRHVDAKGHVRNEGDVQVGGFSPYAIGYRAIVPRSGECDNLLVPVCLSASHIAYGSIRMEPVFMVLGQSAATAAAIAIGDGTTVQDVDRAKLRKRLLADGQVLEWAAVKASASAAAAKTAAAAKAAKDAAKGWAQVQLPPDKRKAPAVAFAVPTLPAVAHRGASRDFPENTLAAFKGAFAAGAHGCEFDVRRTKDGRLVIIHDATFNRTSDVATPGRNGKPQSVKVASVTFEELRRHDAGVGKNKKFAGEKIPSLEETLALFKDVSCRPVVEIKEEGMEAEVVAALKAAGLLERAVVISFSKTVVRKLCKLEPRLTVGWLWGGNYKAPRAVVADALNRAALDLGTPILDISHGALSEALVADLRARGFTIWAWTVDDPARMAQLLSWGVESITTNRPDVLATVLRERAGKQAK
ncbi:MAG: FAD-dependent oxidoreductase, partial [Puniceicoccales bacterium]|nr:FAD-dependent oxidoreductase [Puniceicoccales bacterium]